MKLVFQTIIALVAVSVVLAGCAKKPQALTAMEKPPHVLTAEEKAIVAKFDERITALDNDINADRTIHKMQRDLATSALTNAIGLTDAHQQQLLEAMTEVTGKDLERINNELERLEREKFETEIRKLEFILDCSRRSDRHGTP
jgi:hypothetical protein